MVYYHVKFMKVHLISREYPWQSVQEINLTPPSNTFNQGRSMMPSNLAVGLPVTALIKASHIVLGVKK